MKNKRTTSISLYILLFCAGHIVLIANLSAQQGNPTQFSFVYPYAGIDGIYLRGKYGPSLPVFLLNKNVSKFCKGKTGNTKYHEDEVIEITLTSVLEVKGCGERDEYSLALVGFKEVNYERIDLEKVNDSILIRDLDQIVRSSGLLKELLEINRGASYSLADLSTSTPKVFSLGDIKIIEYRMQWGAIGPRVLELNGNASSLTGQCSSSTLRAFRLNGETYIESGSNCCECGVRGNVLFRITPNGAVLIYEDYNLST